MFANDDAMYLRRTAYKLRQNNDDFDKFYLRLDDLSDLDEITRAIQVNTSVKEVSIFMEYLDDDWLVPDIRRLFRALGNLPKLERLVYDFIGSDGDELPISLLTTAVRPARNLTTLELSCVHLTGSNDEIRQFARSLQQKPWKKIEIYGCFCDPELRESTLLDPILNEMATLNTLQDLIITALDFNSLGLLSGDSLRRLLDSNKSLKNLVLGEFHLADEHIVSMSLALEENQILKELSIGCELGTKGAEALAKMLKVNHALEIFHLYLTSLEGGEDHHICIAQALKVNTTMKRFSLYGTTGNITVKTQQQFSKIMETNFELEELELQDENAEVTPTIEMYLKLNAVGRGNLLQNPKVSRENWVNVLCEVQDDADCLFHLLSLNPALCNCMDSRSDDSEGPSRGTKRKHEE